VDNRILIVDDKPEVRDSMSEYMRLAGFVAESVASAEARSSGMPSSAWAREVRCFAFAGLER